MHKLAVISLGTLACLTALPTDAQAERGRNPLAGQPAVRRRVEMRALRLEISPMLLMSVNQPYLIGIGGGVNLTFHFNDWIGIGLSGYYTGSVLSPAANNIVGSLPASENVVLQQPSAQQFKDHLVGPNFLGSLHGVITPIGGKFALFNSLFARYDFYGMLGFALANLTNPVASNLSAYQQPLMTGNDVNLQTPTVFTGIRPGGMVGIGTHFFFNEWVGLQVELRDYFYKSNPGGLDVVTSDGQTSSGKSQPVLTGSDEYMTNNLYFGIGVTFIVPPTAKISR